MSFLRNPRTAALGLGLLFFAACAESPTAGSGGPQQPGPVTDPATVVRVQVLPDTMTLLAMGGHRMVDARAVTRAGGVLEAPTIAWTSSDATIATVDASGNVVAHQPGRAWITAAVDGITAQARVDVAPLTVDSIALGSRWLEVPWGTARHLGASVYAADGRPLDDRAVAWSSSDTTVAVVLPGGRVKAMRGGRAWITATSEGRSAQAEVIVPLEKVMTLESVSGAALPAIVSDVIHDEGEGKRRRVRVEAVEGRLTFFSATGTYMQRVTLRVYERLGRCAEWGSCVWEMEETVQVKLLGDEGMVEDDPYSDAPIFASSTPGLRYYAQSAPNDAYAVWQNLPGTRVGLGWLYRL